MPRTKSKKTEVIDAVVCEKESDHKIENEENKKVEYNESKPYFFPRLIAYIIDILLVSVVCTGVMFLIPENKNYNKYVKEYEKIQMDLIQEKITKDEYIHKAVDIVYDIDYSNVVSMIIEVVAIILYFIVFQFYNKGQTLGKKLMRLRVVSIDDKSITLNQIAYRSLIVNAIFVNILILAALLFLGRNYYYYISSCLQFIAGIIVFITLMMILFRKDGRGLHDVIVGTKVVQEN